MYYNAIPGVSFQTSHRGLQQAHSGPFYESIILYNLMLFFLCVSSFYVNKNQSLIKPCLEFEFQPIRSVSLINDSSNCPYAFTGWGEHVYSLN